jgi:Tol biopolymer transport system component
MVALLATSTASAQIERVSVAGDGTQSNGDSYKTAISDDGSTIAFQSNAGNLVAGDTNGWVDVFVHDLDADTTDIASLQPDGSETQSYSKAPSISGDGRIVVYESRPGGITSVSVFDRDAGTVEHILPSTQNGQPVAPVIAHIEPVISGNGQFVAFRTKDNLQGLFPESIRPVNDDQNTTFDVFIYDRQTQPTPVVQRVSRLSNDNQLDADSRRPDLSQDGRIVAFMTYSELIPGDGNNRPDIVVRDRHTGLLEVISINPGGTTGNGNSFGPTVSGDGRFVAFRSEADDLVPGDSNGHWDIFVRDRIDGTTERVSLSSSGEQADHHSAEPSISDDGRFIVFRSSAANLVPDDANNRADIFVHDRNTGQTARVGQPPGDEADGHSANPVISGDGNWIAFESDATNLVSGDTNRARDIFRAPNPLADALTSSQEGR